MTDHEEVDEEEIDTLGGLVFMLSGRVPTRGEVVSHPDGPEFEVDAAAADAGWVESGEPVPGQTTFSIVNVRTDDGSPARERLGDWPGDVPDAPRDVTARR